jgi:hypothetical protein
MHACAEGSPGGQPVVREEVLACVKDARAAVLQADLHLALQDEDPLRCVGAVEFAAKANGAFAQLQTTAGHQRGQARLRLAFGQRHCVLAKLGAAIGVGEERDLGETWRGHGSLVQRRVWQVSGALAASHRHSGTGVSSGKLP